MKADRIANFICIWFERRTEIVNFSSRKKSGLYRYDTFETFQLTFHHLYCDVGCYGMVLYGVLCNTKTQKWKAISEERSKKKEIAYFKQCQNVVCWIVRAFIPIFFWTMLYWIWPNFVKCLIFERTAQCWWECGFVKDSSICLKSAVKSKSEKCYIKTKNCYNGSDPKQAKERWQLR